MAPPDNKPAEPKPSYHHRFEPRQKRQRVPSATQASPQKRPRAPLGELQDTAANEVRGQTRRPGKPSAREVFEGAIQPLTGVPAWLLEDCLGPTKGPGSSPEDNANYTLVGSEGMSVCLRDFDVDRHHVHEDVHQEATSPDQATGWDGTVEDDIVSTENGSEVNDDNVLQEYAPDVSINENDTEDLATRLQALPAHTLRSLIYDMAVADETSDLESRLAEAEANKDVPSAIFGYQYCTVETLVSSFPDRDANQSPPLHSDEVEHVTHMVEELLLDMADETSGDSPYATKRAALVAMLKIFGWVFGLRGEGNRVAREMPGEVEMQWAGLFDEVFDALTTFKKQRLATARDGVFLEMLGGTVSSIARAGLGRDGREPGVLAGLKRVSAELGRLGESARRVEELERAVQVDME